MPPHVSLITCAQCPLSPDDGGRYVGTAGTYWSYVNPGDGDEESHPGPLEEK